MTISIQRMLRDQKLELMAAQRDEARGERDRMRRLFDRLENQISHHKRDNQFADGEDERLWDARDKILRDLAEGKG